MLRAVFERPAEEEEERCQQVKEGCRLQDLGFRTGLVAKQGEADSRYCVTFQDKYLQQVPQESSTSGKLLHLHLTSWTK